MKYLIGLVLVSVVVYTTSWLSIVVLLDKAIVLTTPASPYSQSVNELGASPSVVQGSAYQVQSNNAAVQPAAMKGLQP